MLTLLALLPTGALAADCPAIEDASRPASVGAVASTQHPICIRYADAADADLAARLLGVADRAWDDQVAMGFREPLTAGDTGRLDVFLAPTGTLQGYTEPLAWSDAVGGDGYMSVPSFIVLDRTLAEDTLAPYLAHELNHAAQYATDFNEDTVVVWEATATAAQRWSMPGTGAWDDDVTVFQAHPWMPVFAGSHDTGEIEVDWLRYLRGTGLWVVALDERYGSGTGEVGAALWDAMAAEDWSGEPDVLDALEVVTGRPIGEVAADVARARWLVGDRWDERGIPEARDWTADQVVADVKVPAEALPTRVELDPQPMTTGQAFVHLSLDGAPGEDFVHVEVASESGLRSSVIVMWWDEAGNTGERIAHGVDPRVQIPADGLTDVVVGFTDLGPVGWEPELFDWSAGDQEIALWLGEPLEEPDGAAGALLRPEGGQEVGGCGCATGGTGAAWLVLMAAVAAMRRRD